MVQPVVRRPIIRTGSHRKHVNVSVSSSGNIDQESQESLSSLRAPCFLVFLGFVVFQPPWSAEW